MLYYTYMARGNSGRIVIEVDPAVKRELYATLAMSGSTLKDWFIRASKQYCATVQQVDLFQIDASETNSMFPGPTVKESDEL